MRGKADAATKQAVTFKRNDDALQSASKMASDNLNNMINSGALTREQAIQIHQGKKPDGMSDDQFKQAQEAVGAVDATWQSLMQYRAQHIPGLMDPKGKKGKKKDDTAADNPLAAFASNDPNEKMRAAYTMMAKLGPSIYLQGGDPKVQAQQKQIAGLQSANQLSAEQLQQEALKIQQIPPEQRTPEQQKRLTELTTKPVAPKPGDAQSQVLDTIFQKVEKGEEITPDERRLAGLDPKSQMHVTSRGEIIATNPADQTFKILRGPQEEYEPKGGAHKAGIPAGTARKIVEDKNKAIQKAQQMYQTQKDAKGLPLDTPYTFDDYIGAWQEAQDTYEEQIESASGNSVEHVDIRKNVDAKGNWIGKKSARENAEEIPSGVMNKQGGAHAASSHPASQNPEEIPDEAKAHLKEGFITTFGNGAKWTLRKGKPVLISAPQGQ